MREIHYTITNGHYALLLKLAQGGHNAEISVTLINFAEGWSERAKRSRFSLKALPELVEDIDLDFSGKDYGFYLRYKEEKPVLLLQMKKFGEQGSLTAKLELSPAAGGHFRAGGDVSYGYGNKTYTFSPEDSFALCGEIRCWACGTINGAVLAWGLRGTQCTLCYKGTQYALGTATPEETGIQGQKISLQFAPEVEIDGRFYGRFSGTLTPEVAEPLTIGNFFGFMEG